MVVQRILSGNMKRLIHEKLDCCVRVCVRARAEKVPDLRLDAQFFAQFPSEAFFRRFVRLDLAAGEFPLPREAPSFLSLGYENPTVSLNNGSGDKKRFHRAPSAQREVEVKVKIKKTKNML